MNPVAPPLRCCVALVSALLASFSSLADAKEPAVAGKPIPSASSPKSVANDPWQISLTVRGDQQATKPVVRISPLSVCPMSMGTSDGTLTAGDVTTNLFQAGASSAATAKFSLPTTALVPRPLAPGQVSLGVPGSGLAGARANPFSSILHSSSQQPTVVGDSTGNGKVEFVDVGAAMFQLEGSSAMTPLGGGDTK